MLTCVPIRLSGLVAPVGTSEILPSLYVDADTFFSPTVAEGSLLPSLYSDADTFFSPTVASGPVTLTPSLFADGDTFFSPSVGAGPGAHRYWRLNMTANGSGGANTINAMVEMQMHAGTTGFGADQCEGGTAASDSDFNGTMVASNAFDGELLDDSGASVWASGTGAFPHTLSYDFGLGNAKQILGISILGRTSVSSSHQHLPTAFNVQYSDDNSNWTTYWSESGLTWAGFEYKHFEGPDTTSYTGSPHGAHSHWRVLITATDGSVSSCISEMEFRATPSGADQATGGTAAASSVFDGSFVAANAFANDGTTNVWHSASSQGANSWLRYSFASPVEVAEVTIQGRSTDDNTQPRRFAIQYADSSSGPWTTAWWEDDSTGWSASEVRTFTDPFYV